MYCINTHFKLQKQCTFKYLLSFAKILSQIIIKLKIIHFKVPPKSQTLLGKGSPQESYISRTQGCYEEVPFSFFVSLRLRHGGFSWQVTPVATGEGGSLEMSPLRTYDTESEHICLFFPATLRIACVFPKVNFFPYYETQKWFSNN